MKFYHFLLFAAVFAFLLSCGKRLIEVENKDENGNIIEKYYLDKDSLRYGTYVSYDMDGNKFEESEYRNGELDGIRTIFFPNGEIEILETYVDGVYHGLYRSFYDNGQVNFEGNYVNGIMEGIAKKYYSTGELMEEVTFAENVENGPFKEYHKNGQVKWEGTYEDGDNEIGTLKSYDENGTLIKTMECGKYKGEYICQTTWSVEEGDKALVLEYDE